jgi:formiminotetrahydrofolate cyclodeaminase
MFDASTPIGTFLDAAAAKQPTPGGGSVAALAGALAASMGEMTLNYSVGKKGLEAHQDVLAAALRELTHARAVLLQLMAEDQGAFAAVTAARKRPESDPDRDACFAAALLACIRIPQAMAATGVAILEIVDRVADKVNPWLLSDLAVCADLAMATTRCALYNVRANLPDVKDPVDRDRIETSSRTLLAHALTLVQRASPRIWARHAKECAG